VQIELATQVHGMTGADLAPTFRFDAPVPDAWKLAAGEVFKAETREVAPAEPGR
jgi:hypothetical protein